MDHPGLMGYLNDGSCAGHDHHNQPQRGLDLIALIGFLVWVSGFSMELVADYQKSRFNADPNNKGKFIRSGLWSCSRHPNYFGEIVLWIGVMLIALPVLQGWQWVALIFPVFVTLLLTRVSGIPLLEKKADQKWGGQADYEAYKKRTPVLIPQFNARHIKKVSLFMSLRANLTPGMYHGFNKRPSVL